MIFKNFFGFGINFMLRGFKGDACALMHGVCFVDNRQKTEGRKKEAEDKDMTAVRLFSAVVKSTAKE